MNYKAQQNNSWEYEKQIKQERKSSKQLRSLKQQRKGQWSNFNE